MLSSKARISTIVLVQGCWAVSLPDRRMFVYHLYDTDLTDMKDARERWSWRLSPIFQEFSETRKYVAESNFPQAEIERPLHCTLEMRKQAWSGADPRKRSMLAELKGQTCEGCERPDDSTASSRCQTWSCELWCFLCGVSLLFWSSLSSLSCTLEGWYLICAIILEVYWQFPDLIKSWHYNFSLGFERVFGVWFFEWFWGLLNATECLGTS